MHGLAQGQDQRQIESVAHIRPVQGHIPDTRAIID
jgi:hypothetical protein